MRGIKTLSKTEMVDKLFFAEEPQSLLSEYDKEWLLQMANEGDIHAACLLVAGMHHKFSIGWKEMFINEDSGEIALVVRQKTIRGTTFEKDKVLESRLVKMILESIKSMKNEELWAAAEFVPKYTPMILELVNRGEDEAILSLPEALIKELAEKGNEFAAEVLRHSNVDAFIDFCHEHWNDPYDSLKSNPELMAELAEGIQNLLLPASEEGDENAMFWMAECYDAGWGIEPDGQKAFALRRKLAELGHVDQQINMGNYYREGGFVKRNPRAAFCWYMRAAKQGYWSGQVLVADCYFKGDGVKQDYKEAVKWYELAAAHPDKEVWDWDHPAKQLAQCYKEGLGVKKDLEKAAEWYDKAEWHERAELIRKYGDDADKYDPDCPW